MRFIRRTADELEAAPVLEWERRLVERLERVGAAVAEEHHGEAPGNWREIQGAPSSRG